MRSIIILKINLKFNKNKKIVLNFGDISFLSTIFFKIKLIIKILLNYFIYYHLILLNLLNNYNFQ